MPVLVIAQMLNDAQVALDNALTDPALQAALAAYGYDQARLEEGKALHEAAQTLDDAQKAEYGEQRAASAAYQSAYDAAHTLYMRHLTLARVAFKNDAAAITAMQLSGRRKKSLSGWLAQARHFYNNMIGHADRLAAMAVFGQAEADFQQGLDGLTAVAAANTAHQQEKGEAQKATQDRDKALDALGEWMSDFRTVARLALADDPQQLEKLGIVAR